MKMKCAALATNILSAQAISFDKRNGAGAAPALPGYTPATFSIGGMTSSDATAAPHYVRGCQLFTVSGQVVPPQDVHFNGQFLHHINAACSRYLARVPVADLCATDATGGSFSANCGMPGVNDICANLNPAKSIVAHNRIVSATANGVTLSLFQVASVDGNDLLTRCLIDSTHRALLSVSAPQPASNQASARADAGGQNLLVIGAYVGAVLVLGVVTIPLTDKVRANMRS